MFVTLLLLAALLAQLLQHAALSAAPCLPLPPPPADADADAEPSWLLPLSVLLSMLPLSVLLLLLLAQAID